jgi:predicted Fe-Mo cluster-binding NifX family protein
MKIAFSTSGNTLESLLDTRFGRCSQFLILDTETKDYEILENTQNLNSVQGAGIQSAQTVLKTGAEALVTGHCGPKAFKVLHAAGIAIYLAENRPIHDLAEAFAAGKLALLTDADVEGHW